MYVLSRNLGRIRANFQVVPFNGRSSGGKKKCSGIVMVPLLSICPVGISSVISSALAAEISPSPAHEQKVISFSQHKGD